MHYKGRGGGIKSRLTLLCPSIKSSTLRLGQKVAATGVSDLSAICMIETIELGPAQASLHILVQQLI